MPDQVDVAAPVRTVGDGHVDATAGLAEVALLHYPRHVPGLGPVVMLDRPHVGTLRALPHIGRGLPHLVHRELVGIEGVLPRLEPLVREVRERRHDLVW